MIIIIHDRELYEKNKIMKTNNFNTIHTILEDVKSVRKISNGNYKVTFNHINVLDEMFSEVGHIEVVCK